MKTERTTLGAIHTAFAGCIIESIQLLDGKEVYTVDRPFCGKCEVTRQPDYPVSFDFGVYTVSWFTMPESTPVIVNYREPTPRFRIQRSDSSALHDESRNNTVEVQGIPPEYAYLSPVLTDAEFKFIGISIGSVRVTIEPVK